jgi:predicted glycosyltransferase
VDGLNLIWFSDLVISGGGTMNREAAALGVPVYTIFRGKTAAIDRHLAATGRLIFLETSKDLHKIRVVRRERKVGPSVGERAALSGIVENVIATLKLTCHSHQLKTASSFR